MTHPASRSALFAAPARHRTARDLAGAAALLALWLLLWSWFALAVVVPLSGAPFTPAAPSAPVSSRPA